MQHFESSQELLWVPVQSGDTHTCLPRDFCDPDACSQPVRTQFWALLTFIDLAGGKPRHAGAQGQAAAPALGEAGAAAGSILVLTLINAAGRHSGAWAEAAVLYLMLPWLKFYQVLETAGAHKASLQPFLSKSKSALLEDYRHDSLLRQAGTNFYIPVYIHCINAWIFQIVI